MKTITKMAMTAVLLMTALTASAQHTHWVVVGKDANDEHKEKQDEEDYAKLSHYKGTMTHLGTKMEYAIANGIVTNKKVRGQNTTDMVVAISGQTKAGCTVSAKFTKLADYSHSSKNVYVTIEAETTDGKTKSLQEKSGKESVTASADVPSNASKIKISMSYNGRMGHVYCITEWNVVKKLSAEENKSLKWDDVSADERCGHCKGQFSDYYVNRVVDLATVYCNSNPKKSSHKISDMMDVIYYNDYISTASGSELVLDHFDELGTLTFKENTLAHLQKRLANGSDRWKVFKGSIVGKHLKHSGSEFQMSSCLAKPNGTTYVLVDDGGNSRVYLLEGSMDVTSNKDSKKKTIKPGQVATVNSKGKMSIDDFDIGAIASKYGIPGFATTTAHTKDDRYNVKCAIVRYKYTKGKVTGEHERVFDNYGKLERRSFKTPTQETVAYYRDKKVYTLDLKKKTMKEEKDNQLNFGNPDNPVTKKKLQSGSSTILGKKCAIYRSGQTDYYVWKGIVLKKVTHQKDGSTAIYEATSLTQPDALDPKIFVVPMGYKKTK